MEATVERSFGTSFSQMLTPDGDFGSSLNSKTAYENLKNAVLSKKNACIVLTSTSTAGIEAGTSSPSSVDRA